jgi:hypothetical protein
MSMFHIKFGDLMVWAVAKNAFDFAWALTKAAIIVTSSFVSIVSLACIAFRKATPSETDARHLAPSNTVR